MGFRVAMLLALACFGPLTLRAESNIDPAHSAIYSPTVGVLDWRIDAANGACIAATYCSGFVFGQQVGWIRLGAGVPADGRHYSNERSSDFGVNVSPNGALRGYAYGANIGWLPFGEEGNPRVDRATGRLRGAIWSANLGWIDLEGGATYVQLVAPPAEADADRDGLPDDWEIRYAGRTTALSAGGDFDGDRASDFSEYEAGTDPADAHDFLGLQILAGPSRDRLLLQWPSRLGGQYMIDHRPVLALGLPWSPLVPEPWIGTGGLLSVELGPALRPAQFFRVRAIPASALQP
jgi:hypothetical protein